MSEYAEHSAPLLPVKAKITNHKVFDLQSERKKVAWYDIQTTWSDGRLTMKRQRFGRIYDSLVKMQKHAVHLQCDALKILPANVSLASPTSRALRDSRMQEINVLLKQCIQIEKLRRQKDFIDLLTPDANSHVPADARPSVSEVSTVIENPRSSQGHTDRNYVNHWNTADAPNRMGPGFSGSAINGGFSEAASSGAVPSGFHGPRSEAPSAAIQPHGIAGPHVPQDWPHRTEVGTPVLRGAGAVKAHELIAACKADMQAVKSRIAACELENDELNKQKESLSGEVEYWQQKAEMLGAQVEKLLSQKK